MEWIVAVLAGLLTVYATVRLSAAAWYRSRREHLVELARLKLYRDKQVKAPLEPKNGGSHP